MGARSISGLIPALPFAGTYRAFHELLEVYQIIVKLTHTHTHTVYYSLCDSTNLYRLPSLYQLRASVTWQIRIEDQYQVK